MGVRDRVLAARDLPLEGVEIPEWDLVGEGRAYLRRFNGHDREAFYRLIDSAPDGDILPSFTARIVALGLCEADGARAFTDADVEALGFRDAAVLDRVAAAIMRANGLGKAAREELGKTSAADPIDSTSSASPSASAAP